MKNNKKGLVIMLNLLDTSAIPSVSVVKSSTLVNDVLNMVSQFSIIGGAFWAVWGVIVLAGALKDKNGPGLQSGIWQIVGGALILIAATMFKTVVSIKD